MHTGQQLESELRRIAEPILADRGVELVELSLRGSGGGRVLRLDIDRAGPHGVDVSDCQHVSQRLGAALDESEILDSSYQLEVSSPGIDRPLRTDDDFRRNTGRLVAVTCTDAEGAERSLSGRLTGFDGDRLTIETDGEGACEIPLAEVRHARQEVGF